MPEVRYYEVVQTRKVEVTANSLAGALAIAQAAFDNGQNSDSGVRGGPADVWGNTTGVVKEVDLYAKDKRA